MPETSTADRRRVPRRAAARPTFTRAVLLSLTALLVLGGTERRTERCDRPRRGHGLDASWSRPVSVWTARSRCDRTSRSPGTRPAQVKQTFEFKKQLLGDRRYVYELSGFQATTAASRSRRRADRPTTAHSSSPSRPTARPGHPRVLGGRGRDRHSRGHRAGVAAAAGPRLRRHPTSPPPSRSRRRSPSSSATPAPRTPRCRASSLRRAPTTPSSPLLRTVRAVRVSSSRSTSASPPARLASNEKIEEVWTLARAFSAQSAAARPGSRPAGPRRRGPVRPAPAGRRRRRHRLPRSPASAEFVPVGAGQSEFRVLGDVRPGHVGTVADERVDPDRHLRHPDRPRRPRPSADHRAAA